MTRPASPCPFYGMPCQYVPMAHRTDELEVENKKLRAALYDCLEVTTKHHAEDQARVQTGGSDMAVRKAKAILTRSSLLFGKIRKITSAALGGDA